MEPLQLRQGPAHRQTGRPSQPQGAVGDRAGVADLRIVNDDLWTRVKARQTAVGFAMGRDAAGNALNRAHRRKFLLSGVLACGCCGAGYTIMAKDRYGCAAHRNQGTCANDRTILRPAIEARVLAGLKERLLAPELVATFVAEFQAEVSRRQADAGQATAAVERELAGVERKIAGILKAIENGLYHPSMKERLSALEEQRAGLQARRTEVIAPAPVILLHPNLPELYRRKVEQLEAVLEGEDRAEAMELIRSMIDRVVLRPRADGTGLDALLYGDLAQILAICAEAGSHDKHPRTGVPGCQVSVVAGAGFEPATFRL
jgi:site-specific DNA recombinase